MLHTFKCIYHAASIYHDTLDYRIAK